MWCIDSLGSPVGCLTVLSQSAALPITESVPPVTPQVPRVRAMDLLGLVTLITAPLVLVILWLRDVIRPGSFARAGPREVGGHPSWAWLIAAFLTFAAQALGGSAGMAMFAGGGSSGTLSSLPLRLQAIINLSGYVPAIAAGLLLVGLFRRASGAGRNTGLLVSWRDIRWGVVGILAAYPIVAAVSQGASVVYSRITHRAPDSMAHSGLQTMIENSSDPWAWVLMGCAVVGAPIVEELVFRVFLQSAALRLTRSPWAAIFVVSIAFTSIHWSVMPWYGLVTIFALSVSMGLAYERTKRLGVPVVMHVAFNGLNVALALSAH